MVKVLVVGQTPPPYGGQTIMIERLVKSSMQDVELVHLRLHLSTEMNEVARFRWVKLVRLLWTIVRIYFARFAHGPTILYYCPAGPVRLTMWRDVAILIPTRFLFRRTVFHFHASGASEIYERLSRWERWLFRLTYFHADAAIRLSELTPEDGRRLEARREYLIPNGIEDPCPNCAPKPPVLVTAERPLQILFVAILAESKGLLVLIEACGLLAARGIPFELNVVGPSDSDEFVARAKARIVELQIDEGVRFSGVLTGAKKFAAYERADVFSLPSFYENEALPVVLIEAMAFGVPIVSTRWRGIPSMVIPNENGFLVEPRDPVAVADCLSTLAQDAQLRHRMGLAGRRKYLRDYLLERHIERIRGVFLDVAPATSAVNGAIADKNERAYQEVSRT